MILMGFLMERMPGKIAALSTCCAGFCQYPYICKHVRKEH